MMEGRMKAFYKPCRTHPLMKVCACFLNVCVNIVSVPPPSAHPDLHTPLPCSTCVASGKFLRGANGKSLHLPSSASGGIRFSLSNSRRVSCFESCMPASMCFVTAHRRMLLPVGTFRLLRCACSVLKYSSYVVLASHLYAAHLDRQHGTSRQCPSFLCR